MSNRSDKKQPPAHSKVNPRAVAENFLLEISDFFTKQVVSSGSSRIDVHNPSDGGLIGTLPRCNDGDVDVAVSKAYQAFKSWKRLLPREREKLLNAWYDLIISHSQQLAALMTLEQGKPLDDSLGEILYAASFIKWYAEEGNRLYGDTIPNHLENRKMMVQQEPVGVVAAITPWNFPSAMLARKAAAALAAGCAVVSIPSRVTPYSAIALAYLARRAGLPEGVFSILTGKTRELVAAVCRHTTVRAVSYTGSTTVGRKILEQCAPTIKRTSMELGGHAPFIVFADADIDKVVDGAIQAKFQTGGQDCLAANRIYIERPLYEEFVRRFSAATEALTVGDGFNEATQIGPLATSETFQKSQDHVTDALEKGARLMCGGKGHALGGLYFMPTVLAEVTPDMKIAFEETFGPVAALIPFDSEEEVIDRANDTEYGLVAYVYTENLSRSWRLTDALEYGMVAVNTPKLTGAPIPFGGIKQSGNGREGSRLGILEYTEPKYICMAV